MIASFCWHRPSSSGTIAPTIRTSSELWNLSAAENRGGNRHAHIHITNKCGNLAKAHKRFNLRIQRILDVACHNTLLFLPCRKFKEIIRRHSALRKLDYSEHFGFARYVTFVQPVCNCVRRRFNRSRDIVERIIICRHPPLKLHVCVSQNHDCSFPPMQFRVKEKFLRALLTRKNFCETLVSAKEKYHAIRIAV